MTIQIQMHQGSSKSSINTSVSVNSNLVSASLSQEADRESNWERKRETDGLTTHGKADGLTTHGNVDRSDKDQIVRIESIELSLNTDKTTQTRT